MGKFLSHDGVDHNGIRAEVKVETGTGRVKELNGRGKPDDNGDYGIIEVVIEPDNTMLKHKVYGLLSTDAKDLYKEIQNALADQRTVHYRTESQRKRKIDRTTPFSELTHATDVIRVFAALDNTFSHEALTNPAEDPAGHAPSALTSPVETASAATVGAGFDKDAALTGLAHAREAGLNPTVVDALIGFALAAGATMDEVNTAGVNVETAHAAHRNPIARGVAAEEKPWVAFNTDGRVNYGSYQMARAAQAEQFALDYLVGIYTSGNTVQIDISEDIVAQAASLGLEILLLADRVQTNVLGSQHANRQAYSYARALELVIDAIKKRHPVPLDESDRKQKKWQETVVAESSERLHGIGSIVINEVPLTVEGEAAVEAVAEAAAEAAAEAVKEAVEEVAPVETPVEAESSDKNLEEPVVDHRENIEVVFSANNPSVVSESGFVAKHPQITVGQPGYVAPSGDLIARLKDLVVAADLGDHLVAVGGYFNDTFGVRKSSNAHAPLVEEFVEFWENKTPEELYEAVVNQNS